MDHLPAASLCQPCMFCGKPDTDALTFRRWMPVHAACAAKYKVAVWVNGR